MKKKPKPAVLTPITSAEAAALLGVHIRTVRRMIQRGDLVARQLPGGPTMPYLIDLPSVTLLQKKRGQSTQD